MAKVTYLDDLAVAYTEQRRAMMARMYANYSKLPTERWREAVLSHNRKVLRGIRRSAGKSNRLGGRATVFGRVGAMCEMNILAEACRRNNRIVGGLNDQ